MQDNDNTFMTVKLTENKRICPHAKNAVVRACECMKIMQFFFAWLVPLFFSTNENPGWPGPVSYLLWG